jgi:hypothetical protein
MMDYYVQNKIINMTFSIVTVSSRRPTESYYCYDEFFASLKRYGHEPIVLGQEPGSFKGLGSKPKLLQKAILDKTITTDLVIFTDSWDVVFADSPENIIGAYADFNSPFVCSSEKNCFPSDLKGQFDERCFSPFPYKYLNSGFIVSEKDALLAVLESMDLNNVPDDYIKADGSAHHTNDQFLFQQEFIKQPVKMVLDFNQALSQTMHDVSLDEIVLDDPKGARNKLTGEYSMVYHFNGSAKDSGVREPILNYLGL